MRGRFLALFLLIIPLAGCSMDSFTLLHRLTGNLKENVAINLGLVNVDTSALIGQVDSALSSITPVTVTDGSFALGPYTIDASGITDVERILPAADAALMDALATASENSVKVEALSSHLETEVEGEMEELARATIQLINDLVTKLDKDLRIHQALDGFLLDVKMPITERDVIALETAMQVFSLALGYFDDGSTISIDDVEEAFDSYTGELDYAYVDALALGLGQGKSLARAIGSSWLYDALDGVLSYVRRASD